jgi:hypothetical protein
VAPPADFCARALAYLAANAAPGFAHYCRPGALLSPISRTLVAAFICVPGAVQSCPDGVPEIVIGDPSCPASYENEASNSHHYNSALGIVTSVDPFGACPAP